MADGAQAAAEVKNNWGRWGDDDERGTLNLLTPEVVKAAAASIRTGRTYPLGIPIQAEGVPLLDYRGKPMRLTLEDLTDDGSYADFGCKPGTGAHEDVMIFASHTTSHMDALIHVYEDYLHYNNVPAAAMRAMPGATRLGIEKVAGFAARAVLLDMVRFFDDGPWVEPGRILTAADLRGAAEAEGVEVRAGDVVLVRTGYLDMWFERQPDVPFEQAGIGFDAAELAGRPGYRGRGLRQRRRRGHPVRRERLPGRPQGPAGAPRDLHARVPRPGPWPPTAATRACCRWPR